MIEIKGLKKSYGKNAVYDNFNLDIEEGKVTCILGESGSGKTTLLNCIAGLTDYSGTITQKKCSYVFQSPRLVPSLTVSGNIALVCSDREKIKDLLSKVHLSEKAEEYPVKLSGGQAQRVSLARAFAYGGEVLLMDEPFSSLDVKLKFEMYETFSTLIKEERTTVVFVTHDVDEAARLADRILVIKNGCTVGDVVPEDLPVRGTDLAEPLRKKLLNILLQD